MKNFTFEFRTHFHTYHPDKYVNVLHDFYTISGEVGGTYRGEQVHGVVQDHQFGTRLHAIDRTVKE